MVTRQETTVTFRFSELEYSVRHLGSQRRLAVVTDVLLLLTTYVDPVGVDPDPDDTQFFDYEIRGWQCNKDGTVRKRQKFPRYVSIPNDQEMWSFLSKLAETTDNSGIQEELALRLVRSTQVNRLG
jgi:hypothetical protein